MLLPAAPCGGADSVGRLVGPRPSETLGQPGVMDCRPGAGGIAATEFARKVTVQGHMLLLDHSGMLLGFYPGMCPKLSPDMMKDFAPAAFVAAILTASPWSIL